jgi:sec-independent protein translocase protein TatA
MMFDVGVPELVMVLVVALVVFGPGKLPEVGAALGKSIREFRRATQALTDEVHSVTKFDPLPETAQPARAEAVQPVAEHTPAAADAEQTPAV